MHVLKVAGIVMAVNFGTSFIAAPVVTKILPESIGPYGKMAVLAAVTLGTTYIGLRIAGIK